MQSVQILGEQRKKQHSGDHGKSLVQFDPALQQTPDIHQRDLCCVKNLAIKTWLGSNRKKRKISSVAIQKRFNVEVTFSVGGMETTLNNVTEKDWHLSNSNFVCGRCFVT